VPFRSDPYFEAVEKLEYHLGNDDACLRSGPRIWDSSL